MKLNEAANLLKKSGYRLIKEVRGAGYAEDAMSDVADSPTRTRGVGIKNMFSEYGINLIPGRRVTVSTDKNIVLYFTLTKDWLRVQYRTLRGYWDDPDWDSDILHSYMGSEGAESGSGMQYGVPFDEDTVESVQAILDEFC